MGKVYALLVGINDYSPDVGKLYGCLNDIERFHDYLRADVGAGSLDVELLTNADATRTNVIDLFRSHLSRAGERDVVVFHYSGHGARWASAREFHEHYPEGKDEGLVLFDSRAPGGYDLSDKELAVLLSELSGNGPQIAVILDCCHSGSGTRSVDDFLQSRARQTHEVNEARPLEAYLDGHYAKLAQGGRHLKMPDSRHILLAACERRQKAWESRDHAGVFTSSLLDVLGKHGSEISYADLFVRCRTAVRQRADNQTPQFEIEGAFNANAGFLRGGADSGTRRRYNVSYDRGWKIDCGALHGLPADPQRAVGVALYADADPATPIGYATTSKIGAQRSRLAGDLPDDEKAQLRGEITSLPVPPLPVLATAALKALRYALTQDASAGVELTDSAAGTRYEVRASDDHLTVFEREPEACVQSAQGHGDFAAKTMLRALRDIAAWERGVTLQNFGTAIDADSVDFWFSEIRPDGKHFDYSERDAVAAQSPGQDYSLRHVRRITLDFVKDGSDWPKIRAAFKARNSSAQELHCALFYFAPDYAVYAVRNEPLPPGKEVTLWESEDGGGFYLPDGTDEAVDRWKLIVSSEKVDQFLLTQSRVKTGEFHREARDGVRAVAGFGDRERDKYEDEWFTKTIEVQVVRQAGRVGRGDVSLAGGTVTIKGHPFVTANLSLTSARAGSRSAGAGSGIYEVLERLPAGEEGRPLFELVSLARGRDVGKDMSTLELTDIQNAAALAEQPLEIELDLPIAPNECVLPLCFDGEHLLLGGDAYTDDAGRTRVSISDLPNIPDNRRSLGKALKLYFFKTYLKRQAVNRLCWVEYMDDGTVRRRGDSVREKVGAARNVLLLLHGIIGDTENIAAGLRLARDAAGRSVDEQFELVLTFDYENLATSIEDTAADLAAQLEAVGFAPDDKCRLTLLVHSMGGLVARWFIEQLGGSSVVDHLVMCGTPNHGSPYGRISDARRVIGVLTSVALNYFPATAPFGSTILFLLNRSKKVTPTLEEMNPDSNFIASLNAGAGAPIPYTVLAGDIDAFKDDLERMLGRLLSKAGKGRAFEAVFATPHHDIAVRVDSIRGVAGADDRTVACHHLNYFSSPSGLEALAAVPWR